MVETKDIGRFNVIVPDSSIGKVMDLVLAQVGLSFYRLSGVDIGFFYTEPHYLTLFKAHGKHSHGSSKFKPYEFLRVTSP
ncbi:hypothetical protein HYS94_05440 [Candidatus Daviesbacteria bacterium]|nr:hypothetical protein [Candidatus Daviesbacteria bacterium]